MKVGVEEEFIVVDPETLWITPSAFRLATHLVYKDAQYVRKCSVELPLHSGSIARILSHLRQGFCVFELKTDPYEDIDRLREELRFHRRNLVECAIDNNLLILPSGLHPNHKKTDFIDNCAALHVHVDYTKDRLQRLTQYLPFLIAVSANSPFLDGKIQAMSNRMMLSPHVNSSLTTNMLRRNADIIHNPTLNTVEIKVMDSQITTDETLGLVSMVKAIAENPKCNQQFSQREYEQKRKQAIHAQSVQLLDFISSEDVELLQDYNQFSSKKLSMKSGANWQIELFQKFGLSSVVESLASSFIEDERVTTQSNQLIDMDYSNLTEMSYLIPYFPFFIVDKYKKYRQDMRKIGGIKQIR